MIFDIFWSLNISLWHLPKKTRDFAIIFFDQSRENQQIRWKSLRFKDELKNVQGMFFSFCWKLAYEYDVRIIYLYLQKMIRYEFIYDSLNLFTIKNTCLCSTIYTMRTETMEFEILLCKYRAICCVLGPCQTKTKKRVIKKPYRVSQIDEVKTKGDEKKVRQSISLV